MKMAAAYHESASNNNNNNNNAVFFEDFFPSMVETMGAVGFIGELCNGFRLLMDREKSLITFESLKRNSAHLGLEELGDDELVCMLREGDRDGDGALNQMEFFILMFSLSPALMNVSSRLVEDVLLHASTVLLLGGAH